MENRNVWSAIASLMVASSLEAQAGVVVTGWSFNGPQGTSSPWVGVGTASTVGSATANFAAGSPADTSAPSSSENKGWNIAGFASQGTASGERGVQFACSTLGYDSIAVTWQERHSNSASRFVLFQYSIDGKSFTSEGLTNGGLFEASLGGDVWQAERRVDLKGIAQVAGNASFALRIVSVFAPDSGQYLPSSPSATYGPSGTIRFDLVQVEGMPVPAPAATALGAVGAMIAASSARRREQ